MKNKGFTLIELLVVVLIIGILAAIAVPQYKFAVQKSKYLQAIVLADNVWKAQQVYHLANGSYTDDIDNLDISLPPYNNKTGKSTVYYDWGNCTINNNYTTEVLCYINNNSYLRQYNNPSRKCLGHTREADKFCIKLGGAYHSNWNNTVNYYTLPDNFL